MGEFVRTFRRVDNAMRSLVIAIWSIVPGRLKVRIAARKVSIAWVVCGLALAVSMLLVRHFTWAKWRVWSVEVDERGAHIVRSERYFESCYYVTTALDGELLTLLCDHDPDNWIGALRVENPENSVVAEWLDANRDAFEDRQQKRRSHRLQARDPLDIIPGVGGVLVEKGDLTLESFEALLWLTRPESLIIQGADSSFTGNYAQTLIDIGTKAVCFVDVSESSQQVIDALKTDERIRMFVFDTDGQSGLRSVSTHKKMLLS